MKVLTLVLALFALAYSDDETVQSGTVDDPSQLEPGYVLQPDGSYLKIIEGPEEQEEIPEGYVLQPDGTYLKTIEEPGEIEYEDEYTPKFSNNILTVNNGENKGYFKISQGDSSNENDYSVVPCQSATNPAPLNSDDKDDPQTYVDGTQGKPDYKVVLGVGKGPNRLYVKMSPDSSKHSGFKFVPQYISGYTRVPGDTKLPAEGPGDEEDEDETDLPGSPNVVKRKGYSVIAIGRPDCRRYVKLTPSKNKNPYDFELKPIKHPDQPDSSPDEDDDDAPEVIENAKRGSPDYQPVIASGPSANRRYIGVVVDPKNPKRFSFVPAHPQTDPSEVTTEPNEDDIEFEDVPPNPKYTTVRVPGKKLPVEVVSVGHPDHRVHFKIVRRSTRPGDCEVTPIRDPAHLDSPPDARNEFAPEVCQQGDPSDANKAPIVATGPRFKRRYYRLLITKKGVRFIPVRRERIKGTNKYKYILKKRLWHYRRVVKRVRHVKQKTKFVKRIITTRTQRYRYHNRGFLGGLFGGRKPQPPARVVLRKPIGKVVTRTVTHEVSKPKGKFFLGAIFG